ncbi:MAG: 4Fe-4S dicluster domain-containing protein [bacterium]
MGDKAILIDTTKCTACRGCQVACKNWNDLPAENTSFFGGPGYQNPKDLSSITFTLLKFFWSGKKGADVDAYGNWQFLKYGCMHCINPRCKLVCDTIHRAIYKDADGFVQINQGICQPANCNACMAGCPFGVPKSDGQSVRKCNACISRRGYTYPGTIKDPASSWLTGPDLAPACVSTCPSGALKYGDRNAIITLAQERAAEAKVREKFPEVNVYGDTGPFGGLRVISILTRKPGFYSLPLKSAMY